MTLPALLVVLTNGLVSVPPSQWQGIDIQVPQNGTTIDVDFEVKRGSRVQLLLLDRTQADRFHRGRSFEHLESSGFEKAGRLRYRLADKGHYVLMIDNTIETRTPTFVQVRVELSNPARADVRELSPARRHAVVALSLLFFGAVVSLSAWRFLRSMSG
jgi:hypothetical protein